MPLDPTLHSSQHAQEPRNTILEAVGDLDGYEISGHQVLVGIYVRSDVVMESANGGRLYRHDAQQNEDEYQGKVGLILKMGPLAFTELGPAWPGGITPAVGDWVGFRQMEGVARGINGKMCKLFEDKQIREKLPHPDLIA